MVLEITHRNLEIFTQVTSQRNHLIENSCLRIAIRNNNGWNREMLFKTFF